MLLIDSFKLHKREKFAAALVLISDKVINITPKLKAMFAWLITVLLFRSILMMENGMNYHESVLRNVTLYGTDSFASGIPLFMLETDKPTFQAICVTKSTVLQFVSLSLATCRALGYDALQRIYSSDAHLLDSMYHSTGLLLDINCSILEPELQHCKWRYAKKISCLLYLAVHCAECNRVVKITDDTKQEIEFPALMPCYRHTHCDWKILNNQTMKKTVLEFKKQNADSSLPVASMSDTADQMLEIRWFDTVNGTWTNLRGTFTRIANMGPIKLQSNSIMIRYFFVDCQFSDLIRVMQGNVASLKYYNEEYVFYEGEAINYFIPVASCTLLLTFIMTLATCTCCIRKRKQKMYSKHDFSVTYRPGLNVTYEEDNAKPAGTCPAIYHQLSLDDESAYLTSIIWHDCNKQRTSENELLMDTKFHHAEPLRSTVAQLATLHRKSSMDAQKYGSEEEVFSCSSHESFHSFYSLYPFSHKSDSSSESFISINQEL